MITAERAAELLLECVDVALDLVLFLCVVADVVEGLAVCTAGLLLVWAS